MKLTKQIKSYLRGNEIEKNSDGDFVYSDSKELTKENHENRTCGKCGKHRTVEGHDYCLGTLKLVMNACCGHGFDSEAYIQFFNGETVRGVKAIAIYRSMSKYKSGLDNK